MPPIALGLQDAIRRAEGLDTQPDAPWPRQQDTRTYRLMQAKAQFIDAWPHV